MKLYATVSSERASKGQGGNEGLEIVVQGEGGKRAARFFVYPPNEHSKEVQITCEEWPGTVIHRVVKGKKQKGEHEGCTESHPNPDCN